MKEASSSLAGRAASAASTASKVSIGAGFHLAFETEAKVAKTSLLEDDASFAGP